MDTLVFFPPCHKTTSRAVDLSVKQLGLQIKCTMGEMRQAYALPMFSPHFYCAAFVLFWWIVGKGKRNRKGVYAGRVQTIHLFTVAETGRWRPSAVWPSICIRQQSRVHPKGEQIASSIVWRAVRLWLFPYRADARDELFSTTRAQFCSFWTGEETRERG